MRRPRSHTGPLLVFKMVISQCPTAALHDILRTTGLSLDLGGARVELRSDSLALAQQLRSVYPHFPCVAPEGLSDVHVEMSPPGFVRRFLRPQICFTSDGEQQFHPFPHDTALPLFEWGVNWLIGQRLNHLLLFHAGCLERDGLGLLLPATPGSGKSTLTAALAHSGWRLLSDEFGVCEPNSGQLMAMLKPIALKNESIDVIRRFAANATIGPTFPKTRKGDVAHVAASVLDVASRRDTAMPALVVLPKWSAGAATTLEPLREDEVFSALAFNAFNYEVLGATSFDAVLAIARNCPGWRLTYSDLTHAVGELESLWPAAVTRSRDQLPQDMRLDSAQLDRPK